jgi:hypothetical protein
MYVYVPKNLNFNVQRYEKISDSNKLQKHFFYAAFFFEALLTSSNAVSGLLRLPQPVRATSLITAPYPCKPRQGLGVQPNVVNLRMKNKNL